MKIAFTADLHLRNLEDSSQRYNALASIVDQIKKINNSNKNENSLFSKEEQNISYLIICGDLFDKGYQNYYDFDKFCKDKKDINFIIIPGNHDIDIKENYFTSTNIQIINKCKILKFESISLLLVPYSLDKSMDEIITRYINNIDKIENLVLIGHADYLSYGFNLNLNKYEDGLYMPLTANTINKFNFKKVILGHIHKPCEFGKVYYPGSPIGLDITETGKRSFIIYDTSNDNIERIFIDTDFIYLYMELFSYPIENEIDLIKNQIDQFFLNQNLASIDLNKVILRVKIRGFCEDLKALTKAVIEYLQDKKIKLYDKESLITEDLKIIPDKDNVRIILFEKFLQKLNKINLEEEYINGIKVECSKEEILLKGMDIIFSENKK